jgi:hypothetical protein
LEKAGWVAEHVCAEVPHRQFVFTIPKRLRIYFRFDRRLLGELCRAAARTVITVYRAASGRPDAVPGMVGAIQTFGQLIHAHPHIHALVTEGVFLPDGSFLPLPKLATEPFLKLWEQEVFALLLAEGRVTEEVVQNRTCGAGRMVLEQEPGATGPTILTGRCGDCRSGPSAHGARGPERLGRIDQTGLPIRPALLSQVRGGNEDHCLHRAASDRGDREDSPALRAVGRGFGAGTSGSPSEGGGRKEQAGGPSGAPGAKPDGRLEGRALFA